MIFTTITSKERIQTRRCYLLLQIPSRIKFKRVTCMKTSILISIRFLLFDFCGYEKENPFYNDENEKVIDKMKDELNGELY